jgi:hypothetical protein
MKILLAGPDYEENLSIRYLAGSLLSAGHKTVLAAFNAEAEIGSVENAAQDADVVGLSICFQARAQEFLALGREIKLRDPKKLVVAGGHYASCAAGALLANHPEIDVVVIHEGERTLVEIADAMPRLAERLPEIAGIACRSGERVCFTKARPTVEDLDSLPAPDRRGRYIWSPGCRPHQITGVSHARSLKLADLLSKIRIRAPANRRAGAMGTAPIAASRPFTDTGGRPDPGPRYRTGISNGLRKHQADRRHIRRDVSEVQRRSAGRRRDRASRAGE